jgi:hypothetical protein
MFSLRTEGFSCGLDVLYGGLGINNLQFLIKKRRKKFSAAFLFFSLWSSKPWIWIGSGFTRAVSLSLLSLWLLPVRLTASSAALRESADIVKGIISLVGSFS